MFSIPEKEKEEENIRKLEDQDAHGNNTKPFHMLNLNPYSENPGRHNP